MYNPQMYVDRLNSQIRELETLKGQIPMPITQNFQLALSGSMKYVDSIDEVEKSMVVGDTPFFSKDMSVLWVKNSKGNIKTYELNEIIPKDSKDLQIEYLQEQIKELKGMIKNVSDVTNDNAKQNATDTSTDDDTIGKEFESKKSSSISKISRSKKE